MIRKFVVFLFIGKSNYYESFSDFPVISLEDDRCQMRICNNIAFFCGCKNDKF